MRRFWKLGLCALLASCSDDDTETSDAGSHNDAGQVVIDSGTRDAASGLMDASAGYDGSTNPQADGGGASDAGSFPLAAQWVLGYYLGYAASSLPIESIDWSGLTHIALAPLTVRSGNAFNTTWLAFNTDAEGATLAKQLSSAAHDHGVKALLMLGGAGLSDSIKTSLDADKDGFVSALIAVTNELGFDGIDLDVEASNFSLDDAITLASALRAAAPQLILSVPGATVQYNQAVDPKIVTLASHLDHYNIQSYQGGNAGLFTGSNGGGYFFDSWFYSAIGGIMPLRPYSIDYALAQLSAAGIPRAKLGMGVGFYAACYKIPDTTPPGGADVSAPGMSTYAPSSWCWNCGVGGGDGAYPLSKFFAPGSVFADSSAGEQKFDEVAHEPYLSFATAKADSLCGGNTKYVIYEDERSLMAKGAFSRNNGYGGIIVWTIQQGVLPANAVGGRAPNALMQALRKGFLAP